MILDKENLFSEDQAVTASAASTNLIDFGIAEAGKGEFLELLAQVTEDFADCTSIVVKVQTDDNAAFSSATDLVSSAEIPVASLVAGYQFKIPVMPEGMERYARVYFTVAGTDATAGKITVGIVFDRQAGY